MVLKRTISSLALCVSCAAMAAQEAPIHGPVLGFVFDAGQSAVRPVLGIPGAAIMGRPLDLGLAIRSAAISPNQNYAIAVAAETGEVSLIDTTAEQPAAKPIEGIASGVDGMIISPGGTAVGLYSSETRKVTVLSGMPNPAIVRETDLTGFDGAPGAMALSDDARSLIVAFPEEEKIFLFDSQGNSFPLADTGPIVAARFLIRSADAALANARDNRVFLLHEGAVVQLAGEGEGIVAPVAVSATPDNKRLLVVSSASGNILELDLSGGAPPRVTECMCSPTGLDRMTGNIVFRLNEPSPDGPLWLLETGAGESRILFVPPDVEQ